MGFARAGCFEQAYSCIVSALASALSGDVIEVSEGHYKEAISLAAVDVDIVGVGERNNIVIESISKPVLSFRALKGVVRNVTLRQTGGGCDCAVDIAAGTLLLENCDVSGQSDSVIKIHNAGTRPQLRANIIHHGTGMSVGGCCLASHRSMRTHVCCQVSDDTRAPPCLDLSRQRARAMMPS